ncbi:MAG: single-stranded DNA-binding protein [Candidatus Nanopelagicales bacterium]|jgi:single-strand DNA-binding protein
MPPSARTSRPADTFSDVRMCGRLSGASQIDLPSGDKAVTFRLVIDRPARRRGPSGRTAVDAIDCVAWTSSLRRRILAYGDGETIEVHGWLQRRFWQAGGGPASRTEVVVREVARATARPGPSASASPR